MADDTCLQMVSAKELAALKKQPTLIGELNRPRTQVYSTYYACSMNVFLLGSPYPRPSLTRPLSAALFGLRLVRSESFEAGHFGIVPVRNVAAIAKSLVQVDLKRLAAAVAAADAEKLAAREVYDFELLMSEEHPGKALVASVRGLAAFYRRAVARKLGIAMFTG